MLDLLVNSGYRADRALGIKMLQSMPGTRNHREAGEDLAEFDFSGLFFKAQLPLGLWDAFKGIPLVNPKPIAIGFISLKTRGCLRCARFKRPSEGFGNRLKGIPCSPTAPFPRSQVIQKVAVGNTWPSSFKGPSQGARLGWRLRAEGGGLQRFPKCGEIKKEGKPPETDSVKEKQPQKRGHAVSGFIS